jgi:hypothetical protein
MSADQLQCFSKFATLIGPKLKHTQIHNVCLTFLAMALLFYFSPEAISILAGLFGLFAFILNLSSLAMF